MLTLDLKQNTQLLFQPKLTATEVDHIEEEESDFDYSSDEDYSGGDEDESEDDADLFAENVVYGLYDVFIGDDEITLAVDKEIDEENNILQWRRE